jgi:hypothetical protein
VNYRKILSLVIILSPVSAFAEVGDVHTVKVDSGSVYKEPNKDSAAIEQLSKGTEIMEMDTRGDWHEIYVADTDLGGWMQRSDLQILGGGGAQAVAAEATVVETTSQPAPAAKPVGSDPTSAAITLTTSGSKTPELEEFEKYLLKYNSRSLELKGFVPFAGATDAGNGQLTLTVSNKWLDKSKARQKTSLIRIYSRWKRANGSPEVTVQAVDLSGNPIISYPNQ